MPAERITIVIDAAASQAVEEFERAARKFDQTADRMQGAGQRLTVGVTLPVVAIGTAAVAASTRFEEAMTGVAKTVDAPQERIEELGRQFQFMSEEIPVAANELGRLGELAGQLGIQTERIEGFTETIAALGVSTNLSTERAATSLARLSNIMGTSQQDFDRMGSSIVELGNNLATTEAEITEFGLRMAGAGKIAGLTEADVLAIGGALSSVGVQAEAGGTAVQKALIDMNTAVATGNANLEMFASTAGMTADEFSRTWRTEPVQAFRFFIEGLRSAGDDASSILAELFGENIRITRAFLSLANAGGLLSEAIDLANDAWEENNALTEEARKFYERLGAELDTLANQVVNTATELGDALEPAVRVGIDASGELLDLVRGNIRAFSDLDPAIQGVIFAVTGLAAAAGPLLLGLGSLVRVVGFSVAGLKALKVAILGVEAASIGLAPLLGVGGVIALGLGAVALMFKDVADHANAAAAAVDKVNDSVGDAAISGPPAAVNAAIEQLEGRLERLRREREFLRGGGGDFTSQERLRQVSLRTAAINELEGELRRLKDSMQTLTELGISNAGAAGEAAARSVSRLTVELDASMESLRLLSEERLKAKDELESLERELATLVATQSALDPASDIYKELGEEIANVRQEIELTEASIRGLGQALGERALELEPDIEIGGLIRPPSTPIEMPAPTDMDQTLRSVTGALRSLDRQGKLTAGILEAASVQLQDAGFSAEFVEEQLEQFEDGMGFGGDAMEQAAGIAVSSFGAMAEAAIRGSQRMEVTVIRAFTNILQSLAQKGGPLSFMGGFGVPLIGALGGVIAAVAAGGRNDPAPVKVDSYGPRARQQMREDSGPDVIQLLVVDSSGREVERRTIQRIKELESRDGVTRLPVDIGRSGGRS